MRDVTLKFLGKTNALDAIMKGFDLIDDQSDLELPLIDSNYGLDLGGIEFGVWENFQENQFQFIASHANTIRARGMVKYDRQLLDDDRCTCEETLQRGLDYLFIALNRVVQGRVVTTRASEAAFQSCPNSDGMSCLGMTPLLAFELKCRRLNLKDGLNPSDLSKNKGACHAVQHLMGHLQFLGIPFGVLTTANHYVCLKWVGRKVVLSPVYPINRPGPCSVLAMMLYMQFLAERFATTRAPLNRPILRYRKWSRDGIMATKPCRSSGGEGSEQGTPKDKGEELAAGDDEGGSGGGAKPASIYGRGLRLSQDFDGGSIPPALVASAGTRVAGPYHLLKPLEDKEDRITWMVEMEGSGAIALVKAFECVADRDHEAAMYRRLRALQGTSLPRMLAGRCRAPLRNDERKHALLVSWVGPPWRVDGAPLSSAELLCAKEAVRKMHRLGVVHMDMWPRNLVRTGEPGGVCIVDLGSARTAASMGPEAFEDYCQYEMDLLGEQVLKAEAREARALTTRMGDGAAAVGARAAA